LSILASLFKSKWQLEAENVALRHQVVVLRRHMRGRDRLKNLGLCEPGDEILIPRKRDTPIATVHPTIANLAHLLRLSPLQQVG